MKGEFPHKLLKSENMFILNFFNLFDKVIIIKY